METLFSLASTAALGGWLLLIVLPRWQLLIASLRYGLIGWLALAYSVLIFVFFFRIDGAGFGSIGAVRAIFTSDAGLVAGWIHYLAFDLFVGIWIAQEADQRRWRSPCRAWLRWCWTTGCSTASASGASP